MAINNPAGAFNTGRDCTLVIVHPLAPSGQLDLPNVTGFEAKQSVAAVTVDRLDGVQLYADLPKGWSGSFMAERGSGDADDFFAALEAGWNDQGSYANGTIFQYITELGGVVSVYKFDGVAMNLTDAGSWRGDQSVKQTVGFRASRRLKV